MPSLCDHFGLCGGCSKQNIDYEAQLEAKEKFVFECLKGIPFQVFAPILPSPDQFFYRNKMEYSFGDEKDLEILNKKLDSGLRRNEASVASSLSPIYVGLHPKGRFSLTTPTPRCLLLSPESQTILKTVSEWASDHAIPVYVRPKNRGVLRHLVIREGKLTGERLVNLVATSAVTELDDLASRLQGCGVPITTFLWTAHDGLSDVAVGIVKKVFWGGGVIHEQMGHVKVRVASFSFMQTNTSAFSNLLRLLYQWASEDQGEKRNGTLVDLYCGSGVIGLSLSPVYKRLIGVEINQASVEDARHNAALNHCANAEFRLAKSEDVMEELAKTPPDETTVVVDPPRSGLHFRVAEGLVHWAPRHVTYISCNPVSLARDLQALVPRYRIFYIQPMDFFPHTDHVETAVKLERI